MRILHVVPFLGSMFGGTTTVVHKMSSQLARRGHDVTVATTDYHWDGGADAGYEILPFHTRANLGLMIYTPEMGRWLSKNVQDFDLVHMHTYRSHQNIMARRAAVSFDVPYVLQAHGGVLPSFQKRALKELFDRAYGGRIIADASRAVAVSAMESQQYIEMGVSPGNIELIPNGIDMEEHRNLPPGSCFRERHDIPNDEMLLLFLGRIDRIKGLDMLVDAFDRIAHERRGCRLVLAGPDFGYRATIERRVRDLGLRGRVLFTGELRGQEKLEAMAAADVCVVPSRFDIFSMTALEAMACGVPLIVTDRCGIAEMVRDVAMVVGYDHELMADAMVRMLDDEDLRRKFGMAGRKRAQETFDWPAIIGRMEDMYRSL